MTWSFPLAWSLLGLAPLIWWWHWRSQPPLPTVLGSVELWVDDPAVSLAPPAAPARGWDAALRAKLLLLLLLTLAAAGPRWTPPSQATTAAAITYAAFSRSPVTPQQVDWLVGVQPGNTVESEGRVVVRQGGEVRAAARLPTATPENPPPWWLGGRFWADPDDRTPLRVSLETAAGQPRQEISFAPPLVPSWRAWLVGSAGAWFLEQAITSLPRWSVQRAEAAQLVAEWAEKKPPADRQVVFVLEPLPRETVQKILAHVPVWFWQGGPGGQGAALPLPLATGQRENHPVLRGVDLSWTTIVEAWMPRPLEPDAPGEVLVETPQGALVLAGEASPADSATPHQRWLAVGFAVERSDLPLRPEFPILIQQGLHWLTGHDTFAETSHWQQQEEPQPEGSSWPTTLLLLSALVLWGWWSRPWRRSRDAMRA